MDLFITTLVGSPYWLGSPWFLLWILVGWIQGTWFCGPHSPQSWCKEIQIPVGRDQHSSKQGPCSSSNIVVSKRNLRSSVKKNWMRLPAKGPEKNNQQFDFRHTKQPGNEMVTSWCGCNPGHPVSPPNIHEMAQQSFGLPHANGLCSTPGWTFCPRDRLVERNHHLNRALRRV